jgi:hypothetical protein
MRDLTCKNQIALFQMAMHRHVSEISRITQRLILSRFFTHHAGADDIILVYLLVKIINFTHSRMGYVGQLNIFTNHAQAYGSHITKAFTRMWVPTIRNISYSV